ncbi:hypothetical protein F4212_11840 [Candidatus Poribacteria bacterium]|nr:hypothetical protein [Candidatus Poribacteria bacterium]
MYIQFFPIFFVSIEANAKILFNSEVPGFNIITPTDGFYVMDDDGSNVTLLTNQSRARSPRWSPDGKSIVYTVRSSIYLRDANGGSMREITAPPVGINDRYPAFSPDGKYIVFSAHKYPINEPPPKQEDYPILNIYKYHIDTGTLTQLTDTEQDDVTVDWISDDVLSVSPKGKMQTQWGAIKQLLQSSAATATLSFSRSSLLIFSTSSSVFSLFYDKLSGYFQ